ncbi:hypothetical protein Tco_1411506 [Tanacetum coccineum]
MKAITTRSGVAYEGPSIPTNHSPKKVVERETEETTDKEQTNFQGSTSYIQPLVNPILIPEPDVPKTLPNPNIPYPSRLNDQKFYEKASNQMEKIFQIFQDLRFDISFADTLLLMPRFSPTIKNLLMNKEKLFELAKIPLNENCSTMLLKKLPKKLGDPSKFVIPSDPRIPLILGRSFFRTGRALIDMYEGELILRNGDERLIFHVDKHPQKHANESIKMINFIDVSCKDSFGEVLRLKKSNHFSSGSTTPLSDSRPSLTTFENSDSLLEEFADELALLDPFPPGNKDVDFEADHREIELLLNRDPSIDFLPKITIDPNPKRFTDEPALACLPLPGDDDDEKGCDLPFCDNKMIFLNPLFSFNDDFTSSDDKSFLKEDPVLLNTPLFDEYECFDPGGVIDEINAFLDDYKDSRDDVLEILHNTTYNLSPEVFFDHEPQCLKDEPGLDKLKSMVKVFNPGIGEITFSPSYVRLSSKDHHYLFFAIVIQILLTYLMNFPLSTGSEDTIFNPGIFT